jgi:tubulin polyglutamylase TTLL4
MKPNHLSCAKGIKIVGKKDEIKNKHNFILQKYLSNPHLLRGFKYDLRIYILVTSIDPLVAYMYQDGLVRMATQPYSNNADTLKERFMHLTNYSVNKNAENFIKNDNQES